MSLLQKGGRRVFAALLIGNSTVPFDWPIENDHEKSHVILTRLLF
jgi:hypothetical protein